MQTFLSRLAAQIINKNSHQLGEVTIVLPNRRAIVFLKEEFKKQLTKTTWLPSFFSLEDFVVKIGKFQQLERSDLMFELYAVHCEIEGKNKEAFDEFLNWGSILLQDFNEIDRYLVDGQEIFSFLTEAKAIESWNLSGEPLSEFQLKYLRFWQKLSAYYEVYTKRLKEKNQLYQGLGFRKVAEDLSSGKLVPIELDNLYFAGFNALTTAEEKIIEYFRKEKNAEVLWDVDRYYFDDENQEAGLFLREHRRKRKEEFEGLSDGLLCGEKEINIYGISGNIGQAKLIGNLLQQQETANKNKVAVVLADEDLLLPVLEAIPQNVDRINVTMGYPLKLSPFYFWIESYFQLFQHKEKKKESDENSGFYFQKIKHFLSHSAFGYLVKSKQKVIEDCLNEIHQAKVIYVSSQRLEKIDKSIGFPLFQMQSNPKNLLQSIIDLLALIRTDGASKLSSLEEEVLYHFSSTFNRLIEIVKEQDIVFNIEGVLKLYREIISLESVAFVGEPLGGLQLMGVLESRTLDFEEVIISSVNEGILPSGRSFNSFIPLDIKRKFNLPSYREKDAIFAYHFYRLLQRAKKVSIIYNTKVNQLQGGERSRFVEQLLNEIPKKNASIQIKHHVVAPALPPEHQFDPKVEKEKETLDRIEAILQRGLSPSAINTYLACPLDFYYKYVLGLREDTEVEEKIEANTFGNLVHDSLELLYQPMLNLLLDEAGLSQAKKQVDEVLLKVVEKHVKNPPNFGNHKLNYEVAKRFILNMIDLDMKVVKEGGEIHLLALESQFEEEIELNPVDRQSKKIKLRGKIDRIDRLNGEKRIIDYKTGGTSLTDLKYKGVDQLIEGTRSKVVQLMIYKKVYEQLFEGEKVSAGIISLRNLSSGFMAIPENDQIMDDLMELLGQIVGELLNPNLDFKHKEEATYCGFCANKKEVSM